MKLPLVTLFILTLCTYGCKNISKKKSNHFEITEPLNIVDTIQILDTIKLIDNQENPTIPNCDFATILKTDSINRYKTINEKDIYLLLSSVNPECVYAVEYTEMLNETIWISLYENPKAFTFAFQGNLTDEQRNFILMEIRYPIHDMLNLKIDFSLFNNVEHSDSLNHILIDAIKFAQSRI
ncbi:MAG: hypothetical protein R2730_01370 [Chitinophagales bacterium]